MNEHPARPEPLENPVHPAGQNNEGARTDTGGVSDAELNRILTMPEEQLDAEIRAEGGDPDDYARRGAAAIDWSIKRAAVLRAMVSAKRGATCPMCGKVFPHEHSPEEIAIFGNGRKYERRQAASTPTEWPAQALTDGLVDAALALNIGWNAKEPEHLIAERIDLVRRLAIGHRSHVQPLPAPLEATRSLSAPSRSGPDG